MSITMTQQQFENREVKRQKLTEIDALENDIYIKQTEVRIMNEKLKRLQGDLADWEADVQAVRS